MDEDEQKALRKAKLYGYLFAVAIIAPAVSILLPYSGEWIWVFAVGVVGFFIIFLTNLPELILPVVQAKLWEYRNKEEVEALRESSRNCPKCDFKNGEICDEHWRKFEEIGETDISKIL
nr:hypothetical protein 26 [bacterium]